MSVRESVELLEQSVRDAQRHLEGVAESPANLTTSQVRQIRVELDILWNVVKGMATAIDERSTTTFVSDEREH